jgi:hypothetical protein
VSGIDVFDPATGDIRSDDTSGIACWFIDTDYNEESFFVRDAYFLGAISCTRSGQLPVWRAQCGDLQATLIRWRALCLKKRRIR